jgi:hypothetical protein
MTRVPSPPPADKRRGRATADPLASPERYVVHRFGERQWGDPNPVPLVTVAWGDRGGALLRLSDAEAPIPLTEAQWAHAEAIARRFVVRDDGDPQIYAHRALVVAMPSLAIAERVGRLWLTMALPTGSLP